MHMKAIHRQSRGGGGGGGEEEEEDDLKATITSMHMNAVRIPKAATQTQFPMATREPNKSALSPGCL